MNWSSADIYRSMNNIVTKKEGIMKSSTHEPRLILPVSKRDHIRGSATAPVTLVEYGDYECPYCAAAQAVVEDVRELLKDDLRFVFRNFPLATIHPHAIIAAEAAEAAGGQNKFWEMH